MVVVLVLAAQPAAAAVHHGQISNEALASSPAAGAPTTRFRRLSQTGAQAIPITVSWPRATPDGAAIARYELERSLDGDAWTPVALSKPLARSMVVKTRPWAVIRFRVRAVDTANVVGEWAESAPHWMSTAQESDRAVALAGAWQMVDDSAAFGRHRATTTTAGDSATFTFTGSQVAWVARLGPQGGQASVAVDGGTATNVDLHRAATTSRKVVYVASWPTVGVHTITLTATSADTAVDVDAFVVLGDQADGNLIGAGDIASCAHANDSDTAAVVADALAAEPQMRVFTVGDNVYPSGDAQYFTDCYEPTWGAFKADTWPVPGNHEYINDPGAAPYFAYFGTNAGVAGQGWYRYQSGTWRVYALNSECIKGSACYVAQLNWLSADLAAEPHKCVLAMWHRPLFSTAAHGNSTRMSDIYQVLDNAGAEIVISGHDHGYQRFAPADVSGTPDAGGGIREFVVGTGGAGLYPFTTESALIEVRDSTTHGVLRLVLQPGGYTWEFMPVTGPTAFTDSGTDVCH